jgi:CMP-N,N'-diacetyllegionaminic acid synthase
MNTLILIPARTGSKGLPGKNMKLLGGKPLSAYTIEFARSIQKENDVICISSNDEEVLELGRSYGIDVPFKRPETLATDGSGMNEVILHALQHFEANGQKFNSVLLLQPTSPFRKKDDFVKLSERFNTGCDMAVTVRLAKDNPYFTLFEENEKGFLEKSKMFQAATRQQCPKVYAYNGSMYLIRVSSLQKAGMHSLTKIVKLELPDERSIDIDDMKDWIIAEYYLNRQ